MTKDEALRMAEDAIMDELEAVTAEEFEDAAGKLDDALHAISKALKEPTIRKNLTIDPTVSNSLTVQTQALRLAEEAIMDELEADSVPMLEAAGEKLRDALAAIRKVLVDTVDMTEKCVDETPECGHEPVGSSKMEPTSVPVAWKRESDGALFGFEIYEELTPLYAAPVEPVLKQRTGNCSLCGHCAETGQRIYTTPQPRLDVDLTDEEIWACYRRTFTALGFARTVIAKYKEKNT